MSKRAPIATCLLGVSAVAVGWALGLPTALAAGFPTGTYEAKDVPFTVSFDDQGKFHVDQGATLEVAGTYSVSAGELQLTDTQGPWACTKGGEHKGTYRWKYENAVLTLSKASDQCEDRVKSLVGIKWSRKK
jgi:hypothetical protein